ncbi:MAG TPA: PspC domain-containing protein [Candidatus Paceibacterota bacterium]|nr:PspC domain-containing protein [Candidatus Paceibacterota bacterium]
MSREFRRAPNSRSAWAAGVCTGLAYYLEMPAWVVQFIVTIIAMGSGGVVASVYVLLWLFVPEWSRLPEDFERRVG